MLCVVWCSCFLDDCSVCHCWHVRVFFVSCLLMFCGIVIFGRDQGVQLCLCCAPHVFGGYGWCFAAIWCLVVRRNESLSSRGWWTCASISRYTLSSDVARMFFSTWLRSSPLRAGNMRRIALSTCPVRYQTHHRIELSSMLFSSLKCQWCSLTLFVRGVRGSWALFSIIVLIVWEGSSSEHSKCHACVLLCVSCVRMWRW